MTELNDQQIKFLQNYLDPKSTTFSNAFQSAMAAGYTEEYYKVLFSKKLEWMSEYVKDTHRLEKAEKNLDVLLNSDKEEIKLNTTKFVLERLNKRKYSERQEHTGKDGEPIFLPAELLNKNNLDSNPVPGTNS